jgi:hypothetical protein
MAIAPDASTQSAQFSTVSPFTFSHTLAAGSIGAVVRISHAQDLTDHITGPVTVGGVALTRVATIARPIGGVERGRVYLYYAPGIPTGLQTVSITHDASATLKVATCDSFTGTGNLTLHAFAAIEVDSAINNDNPIVILGSEFPTIGLTVIHSGASSPSQVGLAPGMTAQSSVDWGPMCTRMDRETLVTKGTRVIGYSDGFSEGYAMVAALFGEPIPASTNRRAARHRILASHQ